ncbi:MAG TPA: YifB family Mg chelatase-like AAA ATPase [Paenalcaligenes sp.]|nr:YifB family Mg chelatase-like AAA ATPase [Paenalcaligenes sp.]
MMSLAVVNSCNLLGLQFQHISVEVHIGPGLPAFNIVGLPDAGVRESRERVRSAILSSGYDFPAARITINLAPADQPKASGRFDLAIALGILLASGQIISAGREPSLPDTSNFYFLGELSLTGALLPTPGCLAATLSLVMSHTAQSNASKGPVFSSTGSGLPTMVVPADNALQLTKLGFLDIFSAPTLCAVVNHLRAQQPLVQINADAVNALQNKGAISEYAEVEVGAPEQELQYDLCLSDVRGQTLACQALQVAAIGGHSLLMIGPPGVGKSMLAQRLVTLLPPLDSMQQLEVAAINELYGATQGNAVFSIGSIPYRAPHHSITRAALIGGGVQPQPGEISMAHHGVLFLDEFAEFERSAIEALREPLETGQVLISRSMRHLMFPASFQLVAAMNPCACGNWGHPKKVCRCAQSARERYLDRVSGPILDRLDICIALSPESHNYPDLPQANSSAALRPRVRQLQHHQYQRQGCLNAHLDNESLEKYAALCKEGSTILQQAVQRWHWSTRVIHSLRRLARTLADRDDCHLICPKHVMAALQLRYALQSDPTG